MTSEGQTFSQQEVSVAIKKMIVNRAADEDGNIYIPPRDRTYAHCTTADTDIQHCIQYIKSIPHSVFTGDVNVHSTL